MKMEGRKSKKNENRFVNKKIASRKERDDGFSSILEFQ